MNWIIGVSIVVLIGYLLDREIYFYEGVHLGPRVQAWLYDRWSKKYDEGKRESQEHDGEMLAQPIIDATRNIPEPFVLDFATGTGRLSYALMSRSEFKGRIIAIDLSQGMLEQAASKLTGHLDRVEFLLHQTMPLPFPNASFDIVCALEVLELFPNMNEPLAELTRVLRPGGILVTTRGTEASGRKAKVVNQLEFARLLTLNDFETMEITPWWKLFDRVIAVKNGVSNPVDKHKLAGVLLCAKCGQIEWEKSSSVMKCRSCGNQLSSKKQAIMLG